MFQSFDATTSPETGAPRLAALRAEMARRGLDAWLVPRADAHQGEYVPPRDERLAWLTGFTGSAGSCVVTVDRAVLFVDGRYTIQARAQSDPKAFDILQIPMNDPDDWLAENLGDEARIGYDPWLHTRGQVAELEKIADKRPMTLVPSDNLIDAIWPDQPGPPTAPARLYPETLAGRSHAEKRQMIAEALGKEATKACVLTLPDSISWLLNIRGGDIPRNPVVLAFAILYDDAGLTLYSDAAKFGTEVLAHLGEAVTLRPPEALAADLAGLSGPVALDKASAPAAVSDILSDAGIEILWMQDPCILPKSRKTGAEIAATTAAHLRDAGAMAEFLRWLDAEAPGGNLTEIDAVRELEGYRRATNALLDISFDTISGAGPDGAVVHYRVTEATNRRVTPGELLLVDSGGQYEDGTTDITRTIAIGPPPTEAIRPFTLVLKGMIQLSLARWPAGLAGRDLDALARSALWRQGFDYDHGTGHGVGVHLCVHEGPQSISRRSHVALEPGMIVSNEPGYYREGAFGIRIENLVVVTAPAIPDGGDREMLGFKTLTLAPIDRRLIDPGLLTGDERDWLNAYHARVLREVAPLVAPGTRDWLETVCAPI